MSLSFLLGKNNICVIYFTELEGSSEKICVEIFPSVFSSADVVTIITFIKKQNTTINSWEDRHDHIENDVK